MKKIYISAGHNVTAGRGNGAKSAYGDEAVLAAGLRAEIVAAIPTAYIDSDAMKLSEVVTDVNRRVGKNGLAVEIHFNSVTDPTCNGTVCVVANKASTASRLRAAEICDIVSKSLGTINRGVKTESELGRSRLAFVRDTLCPAVIVEICFISNKEDMDRFYMNRTTLVNNLIEYFKTKSV